MTECTCAARGHICLSHGDVFLIRRLEGSQDSSSHVSSLPGLNVDLATRALQQSESESERGRDGVYFAKIRLCVFTYTVSMIKHASACRPTWTTPSRGGLRKSVATPAASGSREVVQVFIHKIVQENKTFVFLMIYVTVLDFSLTTAIVTVETTSN